MDDILSEKIIRVVVADDHEIVRAGLRRLLLVNKNIKILGESANGEDLVSLVNYYKPDIALVDIAMPKLDGIEATKIIKQDCPDVLVVMLTAFEDYSHIETALSVGADGYLTKNITAKELVEALYNIMLGNRVFSKSIIKLLDNMQTSDIEDEEKQVTISKREQEVLNLVVQGNTSNEIAKKLNISVRTVQTHRANVMQKLNIKNTAGLIRYAINYLDSEPI
jgi:DNA-binding NarL/FixJ family response regulator